MTSSEDGDFKMPEMNIRLLDIDEKLWPQLAEICWGAVKDKSKQCEIAAQVKYKLDETPGFNKIDGKGPWHCVVGKKFAGTITHETNNICFFDFTGDIQLTFMIYKSSAVVVDENLNGGDQKTKTKSSWRRVRKMSTVGNFVRRSSMESALNSMESYESGHSISNRNSIVMS